MDQATYEKWWQLHLQNARGESLSLDEQTLYDTGRRELEQDEKFRDQADTRQAREEWQSLEAEYAVLEQRRQRLNSEIAQLESRLNDQTREMLGVED